MAAVSSIFKLARALFTSPRLWLMILLLVALALRLYHLGSMSIWWDESLSYERATRDLPAILSGVIQIQRVTTRDLHPPLYFLLLHFALAAFGSGEFALRVLSTFANVLTVALVYPLTVRSARLGRLRNAVLIGLVAALFAAVSPFYVWYSQEARPYALVLLWSLLALYALLRFAERDVVSAAPSALSRLVSYRYLVLYFVALGAMLATHYLSFLLLPFHAVVARVFGGRRRETRALAALLLLAFGGALVIVPGGAAQLTGSDEGGARFVPFFIMLRDVLNSFAVGVTANLDQVALLDLALIGLWFLGVAWTVRPRGRDGRLAAFLLAFLFLPPMALQLGSYLRPLYLNSRHLITASPAFYIGLALGTVGLADRLRGRRWPAVRQALAMGALTAVVVGGAAFSLNNLYFNPAYAKDDHRSWAAFLRGRARPGDLVVLNAPQAETVYRYYAPVNLEWISLPNIGLPQAQAERQDFSAVVNAYRNHGRIWYLELHRPVADPTNHIYNLLARFGTWLDKNRFSGTSTQISLQEIVRDPPVPKEPPEIEHPLPATFGDNLHLLGYDAPTAMTAGAHETVKLYWRLDHASGEDYGVTVRLVDANGMPWGQWSSIPVGNLFPVSKWPAGRAVVEQHLLPVEPGTPPGTFRLELSAYRAATNEPLPIAEYPRGVITLGEVRVERPAKPLDPSTLAFDHYSNAELGDGLRLIGYNLDGVPARPGDDLSLVLYFQLLKPQPGDFHGQVELTPPLWAFWDPARASASFTLSLAGRLPGDIVQAGLRLRVPGDASGRDYTLRVSGSGAAADIGSAQVQAIPRGVAGLKIEHPAQARLGESIEFLGYNVEGFPARPGDPVKVTLFWRALKTMDASYTVFTHLLNSNNAMAGQNDSMPAMATRPTTSWAPGEVIADEHTFQVDGQAAPGEYVIEIGMYDPANGNKRLAVTDGAGNASGDRILLDKVRVQ